MILLDIWPGAGSSDPSSLTSAAPAPFFTANDGSRGIELLTAQDLPPNAVNDTILATINAGSQAEHKSDSSDARGPGQRKTGKQP